MNAAGYRTRFDVPSDHPSLPGHFPGQPLVAGVLLLEQIALALQDWKGQRLERIVEVKFIAPLLPGQTAELHLTDAAGKVRFEIHRDATAVARGIVEGAV